MNAWDVCVACTDKLENGFCCIFSMAEPRSAKNRFGLNERLLQRFNLPPWGRTAGADRGPGAAAATDCSVSVLTVSSIRSTADTEQRRPPCFTAFSPNNGVLTREGAGGRGDRQQESYRGEGSTSGRQPAAPSVSSVL